MTRRLAVLAVALVVLLAGCGLPGGAIDDAGLPVATDEPTEPGTEASGTETVGEGDADEKDAGTENGNASGSLSVHYVNVGQADAALLVAPSGETMLIDSGDWPNDGETVIEYLDARGIDRLDHLVSTHGHADHVGGHAAVIEHFETERDGVGAVYDSGTPHDTQTYEEYLDAVEEHDVTLYEVRQGDALPFAGVNATVLNPAPEPAGDDVDYDSVALRIEHGSTSFLFTGDAGADAEERLTDAHGDGLDADVYKAGHHGSSTSTTAEFLSAVDPTVAVVSSAYDHDYGHPHEEVLARLADRGVDTYWTATHGTTVVTSDGESLTVATQHEAPVDAAALRDADEATAEPVEEPTDRRTYDPDDLAALEPAPPLRIAAFAGGPASATAAAPGVIA